VHNGHENLKSVILYRNVRKQSYLSSGLIPNIVHQDSMPAWQASAM